MTSTMHAMGGMPMPGGWAMSMAWTRMPEQSWAAAAASFVAMWSVMMIAMMLPSLVPALRRYRATVAPRRSALVPTLAVSTGYLVVWAGIGATIYPFGAALAAAVVRWPAAARAVPIAAGLVVLLAGALQLTAWKARQLMCWKQLQAGGAASSERLREAWRHGVRLGVHCCTSSAGITATLLVLGAMDPRVMGATTVAIALERVAPQRARIAQLVGVVGVSAGAVLIARALGLAR